MDCVEHVPRNLRPRNNFWGDADELDLDELEAERRAQIDPEEEGLRNEEAEEEHFLETTLNTGLSKCSPQQREAIRRLERGTCEADDEERRWEREETFRVQDEVDLLMRENPFWSRRATHSNSPSTSDTVRTQETDASHSMPATVPSVTETAPGVAAAASGAVTIVPAKAENLAVPSGKKLMTSDPKPYAAMEWLLRNLPMCRYGGTLYSYEGGAYLPRRRDEVKQLILDMCRPVVEMSGTASLVHKVFELLCMDPRICRDIGNQGNYVAFDDCVVDVTTGQVSPHTPELFVTTRLKASYAKGTNTDCPTFKHFLRSVSNGNSVLEERIWQSLGYLLVPDQAGKSFILFQGVSHSGKSVLGAFLQGCFSGDVVSALEVNEMGGNFALADLVGKKLCVDLDLPADPFTKKAISKLKKLTGGDMMSSDVKFADRVRFQCTAKFLFATNHAVLLPNRDEALTNRMIVVPFAISVPKERQDFYLPGKLAYERDAIIVQALQHYRQLAACGYRFAGDFRVNEVLDEANESSLDAIAAFLNNCCEFSEGDWTATSALYALFCDAYQTPCELNTFSTCFLQLCHARGAAVEKARSRLVPTGNPVWGFRGIQIKKGLV